MRVVVLNACYTASLASAIVKQVDCAVGMSDAVDDVTARAFASAFYRALGFGRSVKNAFDQGLASLKLDRLTDADLPQLLTRTGVDPSAVYVVPPDRPFAGPRP